jgi:CRISPR/Cas system-associated endonuclease Cas1
MLPPLKPIAMKERISLIFIERGEIDVLDGAFVVIDKNGVRTHIPIGSIACIMLEPGTRVSHRAATLAARVGTLLVWVGEAGVRLYASGQPGGARSDRLLYQAKLALDDQAHLKVREPDLTPRAYSPRSSGKAIRFNGKQAEHRDSSERPLVEARILRRYRFICAQSAEC